MRKTTVSACIFAGAVTKGIDGFISILSVVITLVLYRLYFYKISKSFIVSSYPKENFLQRTKKRYLSFPLSLTVIVLIVSSFFALSCVYQLDHLTDADSFFKWFLIALAFVCMVVDCVINIVVNIFNKSLR